MSKQWLVVLTIVRCPAPTLMEGTANNEHPYTDGYREVIMNKKNK